MQQIDEQRLETDPEYRYEYLCDFIGFTQDDVRLIQASAPHIGPHVAKIVDQTYARLLSYDATARHFVPRQHGYDGESPLDLSALDASHPQIQFRKDHLNRYIVALFGRSYDAKMVQYFDMVGKIHTRNAGNKEIFVPLVQMNALMGLISDVLFETLLNSPLAPEQCIKTIRAYNKLFWIQNDFINRHYAHES